MKQMGLTITTGARYGLLALAIAFGGAGAVEARDYGGGHYHPTPTPTPSPSPTPSASSSSSSSRTTSRTYTSGYRNGGSGYGFRNNSSRDSNNGYRGASVSINTPHRSDWSSKLQAQRRWDEMQYKKMQQQDATNVRCGLSNPPAYCYRLQGPYPTEMRIVRY